MNPPDNRLIRFWVRYADGAETTILAHRQETGTASGTTTFFRDGQVCAIFMNAQLASVIRHFE